MAKGQQRLSRSQEAEDVESQGDRGTMPLVQPPPVMEQMW